jgi:UDP-N-acetylglucosamine diphosphorylase/glucosamine-1-phosphate N-acetyltransferase
VVQRLEQLSQIFTCNEEMLKHDFSIATKDRSSLPAAEGVYLIHPENIFIEEGAEISHSVLNASAGPIYIGRNAVIMEHCSLRGPVAVCEGAVLKMGTKVYGATTIGPFCTAGGEIKNSVLTGFSNKAHDGYLGDSIMGEWCNLGAGTTNSNVKNTGGEVKLWNYNTKSFTAAGNKCGVIIGDYTRTAINTSINTGTVIGVCCNVFSAGLTATFIPDFSWGTTADKKYEFAKALSDIANWKKMKNKTLSASETNILKHIFTHF